MKVLCILIAASFCPVAFAGGMPVQSGDPALGGYCVQYLRWELSQIQKMLPADCSGTREQQACTRLKASFDNVKRTFDLWRVYGLSLGMNAASGILRGIAEANADLAYLQSATASLSARLPPNPSEKEIQKGIKAQVASDARIRAIRARILTCHNGPPL